MHEKFWTYTARFALPGIAALALAMPASGHAETSSVLAGKGSATLVQQHTAGGLLGSGAETFAEHFEPFVDDMAQFVVPDHAVDITSIEPAAPEAQDLGTGVASFYGRRFAGRATANGERFDPRALTAAHRTLPFGSMVRVTNERNGQSVIVRINDRGPFARGRHIDLSRSAAEQIGLVSAGHGSVQMELVAG